MSLLKPRGTYHHGNLEAALIAAATAMVRANGAEHLSLRAVAAEVGEAQARPITTTPIRIRSFQGWARNSSKDWQISKLPPSPNFLARAPRLRGHDFGHWAGHILIGPIANPIYSD